MQDLGGLECEEGDGERRNILHNNKRIIVQMVWKKKKRERKTRRKRRGRENQMTHSFSFFHGSLFLFAEDPFF